MAASSVVELFAERERIRRSARALLHADSPATIGKIISLEQSKENFEAALPGQLDDLHNVLTKMAAKMAPPPQPGVPGAVPSATAAHREREKPRRSRSPSQDSISGHSSSSCRRRRRRRSGGSGGESGLSRGRKGRSSSPCVDSLEQASQGRRRRSQDSPPRVHRRKQPRKSARAPIGSDSSGEEADASGTHLYKEDFSDWTISDRRKRQWFTEHYRRPENIAFTEWISEKWPWRGHVQDHPVIEGRRIHPATTLNKRY